MNMNVGRRQFFASMSAGIGLLGGCSAVGDPFSILGRESQPVELGEGTYPQPFYDAANTNNPSTAAITAEPQSYWRYTGENGIPIVGDERVYFDDRALQQSNGEVAWPADVIEWTVQFGSLTLRGIPALGNGRLFVCSHGSIDDLTCGIHVLDPADGTELWHTALGSHIGEYPTVADGRVYVGGTADNDAQGTNTLFAIDGASGEQLWKFTAGRPIGVPPAVVDGVAYVGGGDDGRFYALDAATGEEVWHYETTSGQGFISPPAVKDGTVYVGGGGDTMLALDAADGTERWRRAMNLAWRRPPTVGEDTVYVSSSRDRLIALDAATGEERWRNTEVAFTTAPTLAEDTLYVGGYASDADGGAVRALDANTGEQRWWFHTRERRRNRSVAPSTPAVVDGYVFVGTEQGDIYALGE